VPLALELLLGDVLLQGATYGPDGLRVSLSTGVRNICELDPTASACWRGLYCNTCLDDFEATAVDEELQKACS